MAEENITLAIATDLHFLSSELRDDGEAFELMTRFSDGALTVRGDEIFDAFLREVKDLHPAALLITGDLTFNGEKKSHEYLSSGFESLWREGIPVVLFPGNHDLSNPLAASYTGDEAALAETVEKEEFCHIYATPSSHYERFILPDSSSLSFVYELADDLWLMCIDVNGNGMSGVLTDGVFAWAEKVLDEADAKNIRVISVTHQNLMPHNGLLSAGFVMEGAKKLLDLLHDHGVSLNLSGHMHIQHIKEEEGVTEIVTQALMIPPCQYGILSIGKDTASYRSQIIDMVSWAKNTGNTDPDLSDFPAFAATFYMDVQRRRLESELNDISIPEDEKEELITSMGLINQAFFAGTLSSLQDRDKLRRIWKEKLPESFWNDYIDSIFDEGIKDERYALISLG